MSVDLIHAWPLFLVALGFVTASLFVAVHTAAGARPSLPWLLAGIVTLLDCATAMTMASDWTAESFGWYLLGSLMFVGVPVALGSRQIVRRISRGSRPVAAYVAGLLVGLGVGWVLLPIVLVAAGVGFMALTDWPTSY